MTGLDDKLVDLIGDLGREQGQVVLERLPVVAPAIIVETMTEHPAKGAVVIGHLLEAVIVPVEIKPQHAQHENAPHLHAGTAIVGVYALGEDAPEDIEELRPELVVGIEVLQPAQQLGDVIAGAGIEFDLGDVVFERRGFEASHGDEDWGKIAGKPSMLKTGCVSNVNNISNIENPA